MNMACFLGKRLARNPSGAHLWNGNKHAMNDNAYVIVQCFGPRFPRKCVSHQRSYLDRRANNKSVLTL